MSPADRPVGVCFDFSTPTSQSFFNQNDFLTWLLEEAAKHPGEMDYAKLNRRMLIINFGAIHTTSLVRSSFTVACDSQLTNPL
jgi:hypothetical protein